MKKLLLPFFVACTVFAQAQVYGGDINYTHLSGNEYQIQVILVSSGSAMASDLCEIPVYCGDGDSVVAPRVNGPSIMSSCPGGHDGVLFANQCEALHLSMYEITHTYPGNGNYEISIGWIGRAMGIANIHNSEETNIDLRAELVIDPFLGPNSCAANGNYDFDQCICYQGSGSYNPHLTDAEGDSLYYENSLTGTAGYSDPSWEEPGFTINDTTGDVSWPSAPVIDGLVYELKVSEWRQVGSSHIYIGSRIMEIYTKINVCAGIDEAEANPVSVSVFPNPATTAVNITIEGLTGFQQNDLQISNALGQTIKHIRVSANATYTISDLPPGIYFYALGDTGKRTANGKFIVSE